MLSVLHLSLTFYDHGLRFARLTLARHSKSSSNWRTSHSPKNCSYHLAQMTTALGSASLMKKRDFLNCPCSSRPVSEDRFRLVYNNSEEAIRTSNKYQSNIVPQKRFVCLNCESSKYKWTRMCCS